VAEDSSSFAEKDGILYSKDVTAEPDSTLYDKDRKEYSYLFREAQTLRNWNQDEGFVVKGSEQQLEPFTRHGYTVIEWGGAEI